MINKFSNILYVLITAFSGVFILLAVLCGLTSKYVYLSDNIFSKIATAALTTFLLVVIITLNKYFVEKHFLQDDKLYFCVLIMMTVIVRLVWVFVVDTKPISDFWLYDTYANNFSRNIYIQPDNYLFVFPLKIGYSMILSLLYRITGHSVLAAKLLNIAVSIPTALLIYQITNKIFNKSSAKASGLIFALFPTQILFTSVLAAEHFFVLFFLASIYLFIVATESNKNKLLLFGFLTGVAVALTRFIRPVSQILFPAFVIYLAFCFRDGLKKLLGLCSAIIIGYVLVFFTLCLIVFSLTHVPFWNSYAGYNLAVGMNFDYDGKYNYDDQKLIYEYNLDPEKIHSEAIKIAVDRVKSHSLNEFLDLMVKKFNVVWGDNNYALKWSTEKLNKTTVISDFIINNYSQMLKVVQIFYLSLLILSIIGICKNRNSYSPFLTIILLIYMANIAAYQLLEAQSRYAYPAVLLLIPLAANALGIKKIL